MAKAKRKRPHVTIVNPLPGCSGYTSFSGAVSKVERSHAAWRVYGVSIEILPQSWTSTLRRMEAAEHRSRLTAAEVDREISANRKGTVFWNGSKGSEAMCIPGTVRS